MEAGPQSRSFIPLWVFPRAGDTVLRAELLLYPVESRSGRLVWQQAGAVMVRMAAGRGQCIPPGPSITFPSSCLSERLCLWLFILTEIFAFQAAQLAASAV